MKSSILKQASFLIISLVMLTTMACKKDAPPEKTTIDFIATSSWKFSSAKANGVDITSLVDQCYKDNTITFIIATPANTGVADEGTTKCDDSDPQSINFTWDFDANFNRLTINGAVEILPGASNEFTVVNANETELVISQNVTLIPGFSQLVEARFVH